MKPYLILIAGLPGTGKSTVTKKLCEGLENYVLVDQNQIRRDQGIKEMNVSKEVHNKVFREIDRRMGVHLRRGEGVIFDAVNRYLFRRQQLYGVASCSGADVLILECVCSEGTSKERMMARPGGDKLISDPNDTTVYDKLKASWDDIKKDFEHPGGQAGTDFVSYVKYDSEKNEVERVISVDWMKEIVDRVERVLLSG